MVLVLARVSELVVAEMVCSGSHVVTWALQLAVTQMAYVRARGRLNTGATHVWQTVGGGSSECYMRLVGEQRAPGSAAAA
jgi:hypothetical protein